MATEWLLQISAASVVEDVLQQHGKKHNGIDLVSRKAEEASLRRYEAAGWLRKMVGVVGGKDLPAEPSEEDFRLGLRSGIILCNALNKVQPGSVPKVVEMPGVSDAIQDGAALSAYQYFENVRNFLVAAEEMAIPTFEASDLGQGGKTSRIVNCVLALKSYYDWKQGGANGLWKSSGNLKPPCTAKPFIRRNSEPFMNSVSRSSTVGDKSLENSSNSEQLCLGQEDSEMVNFQSLNTLVRTILSDNKQEDMPIIVENMLRKAMEEFERRLAKENGQIKHPTKGDDQNHVEIKPPPAKGDDQNYMEIEDATPSITLKEECNNTKYLNGERSEGHITTYLHGERSEGQITRQKLLVEQQYRDIQELKSTMKVAKEDLKVMQMKHLDEINNLDAHLRSLSHAASSYRKILEENRKLYNQVQDLKGNIRVYCRVRPLIPGQLNGSSTVERLDDGSITIFTPSKYGKERRKTFTFNKVFGPSSSQAQVFADTQPLIRSVLDGFNVCIFAYGQTGSGKTHTMMGPDNYSEDSVGVNYRALSDLFQISEQRKDTFSYEVSVQMIEIYNEQVRDLLVTDGLNKRLEIRNNSQNGLSVPDANLVPVTTTSDVIDLMNLGQNNRAVQSTAMNNRSSRSHSCLTVHVQGRELASNTIIRGTMHLVDLAGSERVDKSEVVGDRLKEAQHINKSLAALGDVIYSLSQKNSHVPYRNSKLTQLLQDSLGGQAKTLMFVHISPEQDAVCETISTLKFAERVSSVELGAAKANKDNSDVKELKEQINNLKAALARKEGEAVRLPNSRSSSPDRSRSRSSVSPGSSISSYSWQGMNASGGDLRQQTDGLIDNGEAGIDSAVKPDGNGQTNKIVVAIYESLFLGRKQELIDLMSKSFPELGLKDEDIIEMSWIESAIDFAFQKEMPLEVLLNRTLQFKSNLKGKSDFVENPIPYTGFKGMCDRVLKEEQVYIILEPSGGIMDEISVTATPYPHRKGSLYNIQYIVKWNENDDMKRHLDWMNELYDFMKPFVSVSPRRAYLNYRDLDIGMNQNNGNTTYLQAKIWGDKYFRDNFNKLAQVKSRVDPGNFFRYEQSIPLK